MFVGASLFFACLTSLLLKPWCSMIERGGAIQPVVVPSEPSEAVKESKKKRCTQNVVFNNVSPITWPYNFVIMHLPLWRLCWQ